MIHRMARFVSRTAFIVTICYAALVAVSLLAAWRVADLEGRALDLLSIGFPWDVAVRHDSLLLYFVALILNVATVYVFVLSLIRVFSSRR